MERAKERRNSRATATIVENSAIKKLIVEKNALTRNRPSIRRMTPEVLMWTF